MAQKVWHLHQKLYILPTSETKRSTCEFNTSQKPKVCKASRCFHKTHRPCWSLCFVVPAGKQRKLCEAKPDNSIGSHVALVHFAMMFLGVLEPSQKLIQQFCKAKTDPPEKSPAFFVACWFRLLLFGRISTHQGASKVCSPKREGAVLSRAFCFWTQFLSWWLMTAT